MVAEHLPAKGLRQVSAVVHGPSLAVRLARSHPTRSLRRYLKQPASELHLRLIPLSRIGREPGARGLRPSRALLNRARRPYADATGRSRPAGSIPGAKIPQARSCGPLCLWPAPEFGVAGGSLMCGTHRPLRNQPPGVSPVFLRFAPCRPGDPPPPATGPLADAAAASGRHTRALAVRGR
jgi:hypothetical protein